MEPVNLELSLENEAGSVRLFYRHVNQAERYNAVVMQAHEKQFRATIPAAYTNSPYPLEYYFEVKETPERAWLYPGFSVGRTNQPYFLVREA
jgi:hypothetical protein